MRARVSRGVRTAGTAACSFPKIKWARSSEGAAKRRPGRSPTSFSGFTTRRFRWFPKWSVGYGICSCDPLTRRGGRTRSIAILTRWVERRPPSSRRGSETPSEKRSSGRATRAHPPRPSRIPPRARARRRTPLARLLGPVVRLPALAMPRDMTGARSGVRPEAALFFHLPSFLACSTDLFASPLR